MGALGDLFGGPGKVREYGGGFDKAVKPYIEEGFGVLQEQFRAGPRVFRGERVAGFTDPQLAAQSSLLALSTAQPDYYKTALGGLEEAMGMQRQAAAGITSEDIAAQRKLLEPMGEAQRLAQQQAFEGALRDIGVGAGGAGVGALTGGRADILRGGAAGEFAVGMAGIEGQLQRQALQQAEADRARQASGAAGLARLTGQQLGIGRQGFGEELQRIGLGADVGREQRSLEQQRIMADMQKFKEDDPFKFAQQYLQTIYAAPTQQTTRTQDQSTLQEVMGVASLFKEGGHVNRNVGGMPQASLADMAKATGMSEADFEQMEMDIDEADKQNAKMEMKDKLKEAASKAGGLAEAMGSTNLGKTGTINSPERLAAMQALSQMTGLKSGGGISALATGGRTVDEIKKDIEKFVPKINRGLTDKEQKTFNVLRDELQQANQKPVSAPKPMPRPATSSRTPLQRAREDMRSMPMATQATPPPSAIDRIMSGVGSGLKSLGSGVQAGFGFYKDKIDPFRGYSDEERRRIGMSILATTPQLGESGLATVFRGAVPAVAAEEERRGVAAELARKKASDELDARAEPFEQKASDINAIRSATGVKTGYFISDDGRIRKVGGGTYKEADAQRAFDMFNSGVQEYKKTKGDIAAAINLIAGL